MARPSRRQPPAPHGPHRRFLGPPQPRPPQPAAPLPEPASASSQRLVRRRRDGGGRDAPGGPRPGCRGGLRAPARLPPDDGARDRGIDDPTNTRIVHPLGRLLLVPALRLGIPPNPVSLAGLA